MKFSLLKQIVSGAAYQRKENAAYAGSYSDGGCDSLLSMLEAYQAKMVERLDFRPSEFNKLSDIEVGEPAEFASIIQEYKIKLAKNIKL